MTDREKTIKGLEWILEDDRFGFGVNWNTNCEPKSEEEQAGVNIQNALELLKEQEAVVRCKDCKHGYRCKNAAGEDCVECSNHYVSLESICRKPDWFCADGERRSD